MVTIWKCSMIKRNRLIIITFICLFAGNLTSLAGDRTEREMLSIAKSRLEGLAKTNRAAAANIKIKKLMDKAGYCVYGSDQSGFVVVSRNDFQMPVLGYSSSKFDSNNMPCGMKWWLDAVDIAANTHNNVAARAGYTVVEPLLKTKWDQIDPYNFLTPEIEGSHTLTGCVATAMAQIMKYYEYPAKGKESGYYTLGDNDGHVIEPVQYTYAWDKMLDSYADVTLTDEIRTPIAQLMKDCGVASYMNYRTDASGTQLQYAAHGFAINFSYDSLALQCYPRDFFEDSEWMGMIYNELSNGRPILYSGSGSKGAHAFIFDGVDTDGLIHVNWGWGGGAEGYFDISSLTPSVGYTSYDFNENQDMVLGFRCNPEPTTDEKYESFWIIQGDYSVEFKSRLMTFSADKFFNYHFLTFYGLLGVFIESTDGHPENNQYVAVTDNTLGAQATFWGMENISKQKIISKLQPGEYRVYFASKANQEDTPKAIKSVGGAVGYTLTVDESETMTLSASKSPIVTAISNVKKASSANESTSYFDLQGREVNGSTKGLIIRRQGDEVKKVIVR